MIELGAIKNGVPLYFSLLHTIMCFSNRLKWPTYDIFAFLTFAIFIPRLLKLFSKKCFAKIRLYRGYYRACPLLIGVNYEHFNHLNYIRLGSNFICGTYRGYNVAWGWWTEKIKIPPGYPLGKGSKIRKIWKIEILTWPKNFEKINFSGYKKITIPQFWWHFVVRNQIKEIFILRGRKKNSWFLAFSLVFFGLKTPFCQKVMQGCLFKLYKKMSSSISTNFKSNGNTFSPQLNF